MADDRDEVLSAESFIRQAAAELALTQDRSKALATATHALERATIALVETHALLRASHEQNRTSRAELDKTLAQVDTRVAELVDSRLASLNKQFGDSSLQLHRQLLDADRIRHEAQADELLAARRSLLDSAQLLAETAAGVAANVQLRSDMSAGEREQWRFTLVNSVGEAHAKLQTAAETAASSAQRVRETVDQTLVTLAGSTAAIAQRATDVESVVSRLQKSEKSPRTEALLNEVRVLRRFIVAMVALQVVVLLGVLAVLFFKLR